MLPGYKLSQSVPGKLSDINFNSPVLHYTLQTNSAELEFGVGRGAFGIGEGGCS